MKVKTGFVSNSSSSSFTCLVCGREDGGFDMTLTDADMSNCIYGHIFCSHHTVETVNVDKKTWDRFLVPTKECPVCQFAVSIPDRDVVSYYLKETGRTNDELTGLIRARFGTYENFMEYLG